MKKILAVLCLVATAVLPVHGGYVERIFYVSVPGTDLLDLRTVAGDPFHFENWYPNFPSADGFEAYEMIVNIGMQSTDDEFPDDPSFDDYATYYRGYIQAPMTGEYVFYISSDDESEFYLSTDHTKENLQGSQPFERDESTGLLKLTAEPLAFESGCCQALFSGARLEERSTDPILLERGEIYYFEAVHKEGGGGSYLRLGWERPDGVQEIVPSYVLAPAPRLQTGDLELTIANAFDNDEFKRAVDTGMPTPLPQTVNEGDDVRFTVNYAAKQPATFQWYEEGQAIEGADLQFLVIESAAISQDQHEFSVEITDADGNTVTSEGAVLTVVPDLEAPVVVSARGSGNPHGIVVRFSEPVDEASAILASNYSVAGQTLTIGDIRLLGENSVLLEVSEFNNDPLTLTVSGVKDLSAAGNEIAAGTEVDVFLTSPPSLLEELVSFWRFDEGAGDVAGDSIDGNPGTLMGGEPSELWSTDTPPLWSPNPFAIRFDGDDDYVHTDYPGVGGTAPRTITFWVKTTDTSTHGIVGYGDSTQNGGKIHVRINNNGNNGVVGAIRTEAQGGQNVATTVITDGEWHHIAMVFPEDGDPGNEDVMHFVDGLLDPQSGGNSVDINTSVDPAAAQPVSIGRRLQGAAGNPHHFKGLVDEVGFWSKALSAEEVALLASGHSPIQATGPLTIETGPQGQTILELNPVLFSVEVTGSDRAAIGYQWYRDGEAIPGAVGSHYRIDAVTVADSGAVFTVEAYNINGTFGTEMSGEAILTVISDEAPPEVVSTEAKAGSLNQIRLLFDESLDASAADASLFGLAGPGNPAVLSAAFGIDDRTILLHTEQLELNGQYTLSIDGVKDLASAQNTLVTEIELTAMIQYEDEILVDAPVRYYRFEETSGATVASEVTVLDSPGTDIANVQGGADLTVPGLVANAPETTAIAFDPANSQRILVPNGSDLNVAVGPWAKKSFEMWIRADSLPRVNEDGSVQAVTLIEQGGGARGIWLYLYGTEAVESPSTADLYFQGLNNPSDGTGAPWGNPGSGEPVFARAPIQVGEVVHVVGVMDGDASDAFAGSLILYINGQEVGTQTGVGQIYNHSGNIQIGRGNHRLHDNSTGNTGFFHGVIDEVAMYNTALTAERVKVHYDTAFVGAIAPGAPVITKQPEDKTVREHAMAEFSIEFTGTPPWTVTWFKDGEEIGAGAELGTSSVSFAVTAEDEGAIITATVENAEGSDQSREAVLSVELDLEAPGLVSARAIGGNVNQVVLVFDELLDASLVGLLNNYQIAGLDVLGATLGADGMTVTLDTSEQELGTTYEVSVSGIKDVSSTGNEYVATINLESSVNYQDEVMWDGPVAYWSLGDRSGTEALNRVDASGSGTYASNSGLDLPELGAERLVVGSPDTAVRLSGANETVVQLPDITGVNIGGPWKERTVELWFMADSLPAHRTTEALPDKVTLYEEGGLTRGISIYIAGNEVTDGEPASADLHFHAWNLGGNDGAGSPWGGVGGPVTMTAPIVAGQVYHAVLVIEGDDTGAFGGQLSGYLNGELVQDPGLGFGLGVGLLYNHGDNGGIGAVVQNALYADEGRGAPFADPFSGTIDEVAVYNLALSQERVQEHYTLGQTEVPLADEPPVAGLVFTSILLNGGNITLEWEGDARLQSSTTVDGQYVDVAGAVSGHTEAVVAGEDRFFRLIQ